LLSRSLSGLDLPKSKPAAVPTAPPRAVAPLPSVPAPAPPAAAQVEPPKPVKPKEAPPKPPVVEAAKVEAPSAPAAKSEPAKAPPPAPPAQVTKTPTSDRPSKSFRAPEELLKEVTASAAEKSRTGSGEFKRKDFDFSKLDELVKTPAKTTTKSGAGRPGEDFRTQRIETVRPSLDGPREFGQYTLMRRIATGGMAEVWQARMKGVEGFQKTVAIKKILPSLTDSVDFVTMFIDEAKLAAQLQHNGIIHIYDLGKIGDDYYIAMEYVEGKDLRSILNQARAAQRPMSQGLALLVAARLAAALDYAHRKKDFEGRELGLVHRDVSPQNVLIGYEGDIKLCDFGIVKAVSKASKTQMGALKGKLQYMSPEQAWGKPVDARSDIFSLGALLFEMLTGRRLFAGDSEISILDAVREGRMDRPRSVDPTIPREVDELVMRALARDPDDRFETAGQMQRELEKVLSGTRPQPAQADLAHYMHELFGAEARAEQPPAAAAVAVAPPEILTPIASEVSPPRAGAEVAAIPPREGTRAGESEGKGRGLLIAAIVAAVLVGAGLYYFFGRGKAVPEAPPPAAEPVSQAAPPPESAAPGDSASAAGEAPLPAAETAPASTAPASPPPSPPAQTAASPAPAKPAELAKPAPPVVKLPAATAKPVTPESAPPVPAPVETAPAPQPEPEPPAPVEQTPPPAPEPAAAEPEPPAPAPAAPAVQVGELAVPGPGVVPPSLVNRPSPAYPQMAKMQRVEGVVSVEVLVDENGAVRDSRFVKKVTQNVGLNEAAMTAAQQAKFRPATKSGVRVKMWYTLTFPFKL
jgi:TonB family protein